MNKKILLIIPAYNEEASIEKTMQDILPLGYDYVIINDGSTDRTEQILEDNHYNHVTLISNLGIGGAVQTGYQYACDHHYNIAIQFDADGQHDPKYIPALIAPILESKADLVIGSCFMSKSTKVARSSKIRRLGIRFLSGFIKLFSGKRLTDPTSGFRAADSKVIAYFAEQYPLEYPEPVSNFELLKNKKFTIQEVPVTMHKRARGKSSISPKKSAYAAFNVVLSILILSIGRKNHE